MTGLEKAKEYLSKDFLTNCGLLQVINRSSAEIVQLDHNGVLLYDTISKTYMLGAEYGENILKWFENLELDYIFITNNKFVPFLKERYGFKHDMKCYQYVYPGNSPIEYQKRLEVSSPTREEMKIVKKNYKNLSENDLDELNALGYLYAAHDSDGNMVGFVGSHFEGSMGLLEILPQYRRMGYGYELECFIINKFLEMGLIPYCQVKIRNDKSKNLQSKLNMTKAPGQVDWLL
jgi:ribosomal protein S18 acetylase RimI-like enzyme